jgi:signal transduction histidine kinase
VPLVDNRVADLELSGTSTAKRSFTILIGALIGLTVLSLLLTALVARAIVRPVKQLSRAADDVARTLQAADLDQEAPHLQPIDLHSSWELNLAATSFNTLIGTTTGLLDRHAGMRRNLSEIFQNLGRRNHSLLTRSLQVITELEQSETDPETLDRLFRLDHLATRIRRNAENLLVLAGSQSARIVERQSNINDILRSALSEIEAYTRVDRPELEPVGVKAGSVADVTHLLAELVENATTFSPPECRVRVLGAFVDDGYAVTVIDEGLGMRDDAIEEANQRIQKVTSLDLTPTRTLGLYVVGRLAQRHGIRVRLLEGSLRGTVAKVVLPMAILAEAAPERDFVYSGQRFDRPQNQPSPVEARNTGVYSPAVVSSYYQQPPAAGLPLADRVTHRGTAVAPPARPTYPESAPDPWRESVAPGAVPSPAPASAGPGRPSADEVSEQERGGMKRRVRGAQMPATELVGLGQPTPAMTSDEDLGGLRDQQRNSLRSFQQAVDQGTRDARSDGGSEP